MSLKIHEKPLKEWAAGHKRKDGVMIVHRVFHHYHVC